MSDKISNGEIHLLQEYAADETIQAGIWANRSQALEYFSGREEKANFSFYATPARISALIDRLHQVENENEELRALAEEVTEEELPKTWPEAVTAIMLTPFGWLIGFALMYLVIYMPDMIKNANITTCVTPVTHVQTK